MGKAQSYNPSRCGTKNIIVAAKRLADARQTALSREHQLRTQYVPNTPAGVRTAMVDPHGAITQSQTPKVHVVSPSTRAMRSQGGRRCRGQSLARPAAEIK